MIPAQPGFRVAFKNKSSSTKPAREEWVGNRKVQFGENESWSKEAEVVAWDDEGDPMIIDDGSLTSPKQYKNYLGVIDERTNHIVQLIPAGDWIVWRYNSIDGEIYSSRLAAWGLCADSTTVALESDGDGGTSRLNEYSTEVCELRHQNDGPPNDDLVAALKHRQLEADAKQAAENEKWRAANAVPTTAAPSA